MNIADERGAFLAEFCEALGKFGEDAVGFGGIGDAIGADVNDGGAGTDVIVVIMAGRPMAAMTMSARRAVAGRSRVFEWQMVTVALACMSSRASGLPTMSLRPITALRRLRREYCCGGEFP